ncbi:MAG TPA: hypothetical protein VH988_20460 [Thermoanaerobaculia bacterium]|jgi:hypothetical protein|nr:hypothetical protein [Thermoanaerobaculia bacterium]
MLWRSTILSLALATLATLATSTTAGAAQAAGEKVTFHFVPPLDATYVATSKVMTSRTTPRGQTRTTENDITSKMKTSRNGQSVVQTFSVTNAINRLDGKLIASPLLRVLKGLDLTYALGPDGQATGLVNFPGLLAAMKKAQPPERVDAASPFFTEEGLLARRRAVANPLTAGLAGKILAIGQKVTLDGNALLPTGETFAVHYNATLKGREKTPNCDCVRIDFTSESLPVAGKPKAVGVKGKGSALVDPATLTTWALQNEEAFTMEEPGASTLMTITMTVDDALAPDR